MLCSCAAACAVRCAVSPVHAQVWCVCRSRECLGTQRSLSEEQYLQVVGRCAMEAVQTQDSRSICQLHHDRWVHRYKPTQCAACPQPLPASASMLCPKWLREQLAAHHGARVHVRPCYLAAMAAKKQQASNNQPMEIEEENEQSNKPFTVDVSTHEQQHTEISMHAHTFTIATSASLCMQTDSDGGEHSQLFAFEGAASQRSEAQSRRGRRHCYSADDNPWQPSAPCADTITRYC